MDYRRLGHSGIDVSPMGLGCWAIGGVWRRPADSVSWREGDEGFVAAGWGEVDDAESIRAIHAALDMGITFFDTSEVYGCGHSEHILGKALTGRRDKAVIATKVGNRFDEATKTYYGHEISPESMRRACEESLRRLNTDTIDLYQLHWSDYDGDAGEIREAFEALAAEGKIRAYGWSTDDPGRMRLFAEGEHCAAVQHALTVLADAPEMLALCEEHDLASINRSVLHMGLLTGKFSADTTFPEDDIRHAWNFREGPLAERLKQVEAIRDVLTSGGRTMVQGALAWIWARSERTIPIPGFKTVRQAEENAGAMAFGPLTAGQMRQINELLGRGEM
jgi:aryl-alcohol dehydrogenase-like predicted oxidoreductase